MRINLQARHLGHAGAVAPPSGDVEHPEIKAALVRYEQAITAERELCHERATLTSALEIAEQKDAEATADAVEAGAKDPGSKHADATRKQKRIEHAGVEYDDD